MIFFRPRGSKPLNLLLNHALYPASDLVGSEFKEILLYVYLRFLWNIPQNINSIIIRVAHNQMLEIWQAKLRQQDHDKQNSW